MFNEGREVTILAQQLPSAKELGGGTKPQVVARPSP